MRVCRSPVTSPRKLAMHEDCILDGECAVQLNLEECFELACMDLELVPAIKQQYLYQQTPNLILAVLHLSFKIRPYNSWKTNKVSTSDIRSFCIARKHLNKLHTTHLSFRHLKNLQVVEFPMEIRRNITLKRTVARKHMNISFKMLKLRSLKCYSFFLCWSENWNNRWAHEALLTDPAPYLPSISAPSPHYYFTPLKAQLHHRKLAR